MSERKVWCEKHCYAFEMYKGCLDCIAEDGERSFAMLYEGECNTDAAPPDCPPFSASYDDLDDLDDLKHFAPYPWF